MDRPFRIPVKVLPAILEGDFSDLTEKEIDCVEFFLDVVKEQPGEFTVIGGPDYFLPPDVVEHPPVVPHNWVNRYDVTFDVEYNIFES